MPSSEKKIIEAIRRKVIGTRALVRGIGDDCAILRIPSGNELLVTTDFSIENVHFRRKWHPAELVGRRCLTRGLSDVAAMGGEPVAAFLSLAVDGKVPQTWVNRFMEGLLQMADEFHVPLAGGDTAQSAGGIQADIAVVGSVPKGTAVLRSGAKPGDRIYVTGQLGGGGAALDRLMKRKPLGSDYAPFLRPEPRLAVGQWLRREKIASAMIDLSDGLSTDLGHICQESRVGAELDSEAIPRAALASRSDRVGVEFALNGGDEYELLFTAASDVPAKIAGIRVTAIGRITRPAGMRLVGKDGRSRRLKTAGWEHFKGDL